MTLGGNVDYTPAAAGPLTTLATVQYNAVNSQTDDVSALITAAHAGLYFLWTAQAPTAGSPVVITVQLGTGQFISQATHLTDGAFVIVPIPGRFIVDNAVAVNVQMQTASDGSAPITGQLLVFGIATLPVALIETRAKLIGVGFSTGNISCPAAATTPVLTNPVVGTFYRIKHAAGVWGAAPAVNIAPAYDLLNSGAVFYQKRTANAQNDPFEWTGDIELDQGLAFNNSTGVSFTGRVLYEVWQR